MNIESTRMPAVFLGHGNPMNAIERNPFHASWERLGKQLPGPKAVLCISAHWEAPGVRVTSSQQPETIHDFHGFPKELLAVEYPAHGDPELVRRVSALLHGHEVVLDSGRSPRLDRGWRVLRPGTGRRVRQSQAPLSKAFSSGVGNPPRTLEFISIQQHLPQIVH